ncbi:MAG: ABC transporter substrate-binding protein [Acidimicrobiia bacterium]
MKKSTTTVVRLLSASIALSLIAAACGDDGGDSASTTAAAAETTAASTATTAAGTATTAGGTATTAAAGAKTADELLAVVNEAKGEPVKIGFMHDGKSAAVDNTDDWVVAQATVAYMNKSLGGIAGRPIELVECQSLDDNALATDCGNKFVEEKVNAVLLATSGRSGVLWDAVNPSGIPYICGACNDVRVTSDAKSTYTMVNGLAGSLAAPVAFAKQVKAKAIAAMVIGMPSAVDPQAMVKAAAEAAGMTFDLVSIPPGTPDMSSQVAAMLTKNPDLVNIVGDPTFCLTALTALNDAGYKGTIQTADYCVSSKVYEPLPAEVKTSLKVQASVAMGLPAGKSADWDLYQGIMKKYGSKIPEVSGVRGWAYQVVWAMFLGANGGKIDPKNINKDTFNAAMKAAPEQVLPLTEGNTFKCDGKSFAGGPAICPKSATLETTLDKDANFVSYKALDVSAEVDAILAFLAKAATK